MMVTQMLVLLKAVSELTLKMEVYNKNIGWFLGPDEVLGLKN